MKRHTAKNDPTRLHIPRVYKGYAWMDMWIDADPVGLDPVDGSEIYLFDASPLTCDIDVTSLGYRPFKYTGTATFPSDIPF